AASELEPTRSHITTVISRRSAALTRTWSPPRLKLAGASRRPHAVQKCCPGAATALHSGHDRGNGVPHSLQNRAPAGATVPQPKHWKVSIDLALSGESEDAVIAASHAQLLLLTSGTNIRYRNKAAELLASNKPISYHDYR